MKDKPTRSSPFKIAHLSDPHINRRFHPSHIKRLRAGLEQALEAGADHIVISGDITSNADERDLNDARKLFSELGILNAQKLSLVIGNHDIFGGPHLAEDLVAFPGRCADRDYQHHVDVFCATFEETFYGALRLSSNQFPYLKVVGNAALIGMNSVAERSPLKNPVGSNGSVSPADLDEMNELLKLPAASLAKHRIVMMHHHLFRKKDEKQFHDYYTSKIFQIFEQETLKLRGKRKVLKALEAGKVDLVLHGHVHFTAEYTRKSIRCSNGAGSTMPLMESMGLRYNMITMKGDAMTIEPLEIAMKPASARASAAPGQRVRTVKSRTISAA